MNEGPYVCLQSTVCLFVIVLIVFLINLMFFKNILGVCEKHQDHFINCLRERYLTHKGAKAYIYGGVSRHSLRRF